MTDKEELKHCPDCGEVFDNVFDATDHLLEEDEVFDPALLLPNGYRLMIGSLLRYIYRIADDPTDIKRVAESTYLTLFSAEMEPDMVKGIVEEMIVNSSMADLDEELKHILENGER